MKESQPSGDAHGDELYEAFQKLFAKVDQTRVGPSCSFFIFTLLTASGWRQPSFCDKPCPCLVACISTSSVLRRTSGSGTARRKLLTQPGEAACLEQLWRGFVRFLDHIARIRPLPSMI